MNIIAKTFKHFHTVNKHRWYVFRYSVKAGIPIRGLLHDLSKYSFVEFFESVKYFDGHESPTHLAKIDKGYTKAWLHHKGRNKHHLEYWEDRTTNFSKYSAALIPYKYLVESLCDRIAAGKTYKGKSFNHTQPLKYWNNIERNNKVEKHPGVVEFFDTTLKKMSDEGINETLKPKYLKKVYKDIYDKYKNERQ